MLKNRIRWGDPMAHLVKVTAVTSNAAFNWSVFTLSISSG
jgi:hypothetical protein